MLLKHTVQLRRLKQDVLDQLPPKTRALKPVPLDLKDEQACRLFALTSNRLPANARAGRNIAQSS